MPPASQPLIIDHPVAIVLNSPQNTQVTSVPDYQELLNKVLNPLRIPFMQTQEGQLEFIKQNGDKVVLESGTIRTKYDLILFNARNNPLPVRFDELSKTALSYFITPKVNEEAPEPEKVQAVTEIPTDTITHKRFLQWFNRGNSRTVTVQTSDTSTGFRPRQIEGIRWIESRLDSRKIFTVTFENDLITYANTDRYFTNGITFSLQSPWLGRTKLAGLMINYGHTSNVNYSLKLVQNMYTPTDTRVAPRLHDDRPYASYLYLAMQKSISDPHRYLRLSSEFVFGYLGPYSPGSYLQTMVHSTFPTNDKPLGWETQLNTDVLLNYSLRFEKAFIHNQNLMLASTAQVKLGSLYSQAGGGILMRAGRQDPYFGWNDKASYSKWQYYFFVKTELNCIGYDATLQGGLLDRDNVYSLHSNEISHWVGCAEIGLTAQYKSTGIEIAQHYLTPEYKGGLSHKWGRISLLFKL